MTGSALQVLKTFRETKQDKLDLHVLFEFAGNDPDVRASVLDAVEELAAAGMIQSVGGDFYALTEMGKRQWAALVG